MKKLIALFLAVLTLVSSTAVFAYGADSPENQNNHTHSRNYYPTCTDEAHAFLCSECSAMITEPHKLDAEGKCECGYIEHTHSRNYYPTCTDKAHGFLCSECPAAVTEFHKLDAEGKCDCGYIEHTHSRNYFPTCTDQAHVFSCSECPAVITELHKPDAEGKCDCGYIGAVESESAIVRFFNNIADSFKNFFVSIGAFFKNLFSFSFNTTVSIREQKGCLARQPFLLVLRFFDCEIKSQCRNGKNQQHYKGSNVSAA